MTKRQLLGAVFALTITLQPQPTRAQVPVFDFTRWLKMFKMLEDAQQLTNQVSASLTHVKNAAETLGHGNLLDDILISQRYLTSDVQAISYSIDTVTSQFQAMFPSQEAAAHVAPADVATVRSNWGQELQQSGLAAARAQSALSRIDSNTKSAMDILERSKATTGGTSDEGSRLAKLQALVQMLGIINSDLTTLATTLAASERINADVAAAEASDEDLEAAKAQRMLRGFNTHQPIPEIDPRLLRE
jgi:conjugal transfer/entry exclusion protein